MGQLRLHVPWRNIWKHHFMIPHAALILMKIFTTRLASFCHDKSSISPGRKTDSGICCRGAQERSNAFCHNNRKKGHIFLQFPSGQQTHCCSDSSSFRQSQRSLGILTLGENQLIIQNPPSQQGTGNPGAYMHKTISQWNLPIMQKQPHQYVAMGFCSIRRADTEMERVIAHVNVL